MKNKYILLFVLLIINIVMLCFAPRFGWTLHSNDPFNPYKYKEYRKADNQILAVYESSDSTLKIGYENRFSRNLEIQLDNEEMHNVKINIDGGINNSPQWIQQPVFNFVFNDIVWNDSSGIFYYRYIFVFVTMFGYVFCFIRTKPVLKTFYFSAGVVLFILSTLISLRIIL